MSTSLFVREFWGWVLHHPAFLVSAVSHPLPAAAATVAGLSHTGTELPGFVFAASVLSEDKL